MITKTIDITKHNTIYIFKFINRRQLKNLAYGIELYKKII